MYGEEPELYREVIEYWHFGWPQILFIANFGAQTNLKDWRMRMANNPNAYHNWRSEEEHGKMTELSPLQLFKFFRKYEKQIWEGAEVMGGELEGSNCTALKFIGGLNGADKVRSLNDIGILAAKWSIEEVCQRIYQDWEEHHKSKEEGEEEGEGAEFSDIWGSPSHGGLHSDLGAYEESIMRRLRGGN